MHRTGYYSFGPGLTPAVKNLLIANVAVFFLMYFFGLGNIMIEFFSLVPYLAINNFQIWRFVSYIFLHGGFGHIFFNMFALWMFGVGLERIWGSKEFYKFFFITGVFAGLSSAVFNFGSMAPTIGASGAVYGVLMAYALLFPEVEIYLYFLFPIKMKYFALIIGAIEFISSFQYDGIAHFAHLGGMVAGYLYLKSKYGNAIPNITDLFKKKHY
ncbi:MAG: hypothetical protein Kow00108_20960 [Calditrichia bacterium]